MTRDIVEASLTERGWAVIDLPNKGPILAARERILARLRQSLPGLARMGDYHRHVDDEDRHIAVMLDAARMYWAAKLGEAIVGANLDIFHRLAGAALHIQRRPYLRAVRPRMAADAPPLHRDTLYGASPQEISILVPFTDMPADRAVRAIPGSHLEPDEAYPYVQTTSPDVAIGSPKHLLGYAYAPRLLSPALEARAEPVPLAVGQAMVFGLSLVHGGGVNTSQETRFSSDIRIVNSLASVRRNRGVDAEYFVPLGRTPIDLAADLAAEGEA